MYIHLHVKYLLFLSDFSETWIFWTDFLKILKNQISWKSVHLEPSSTWRDGQTDLAKLIVSFRSFGNASKNGTGSWDVMPINIWPLFQTKLLPLLWGQIPLSRVLVLTAALCSEVSVSGHSALRSGSSFP